MEVLDAVSANPGFRINNTATLGNVLRGNGLYFVSAVLGSGDITNADFVESVTGTASRLTSTGGLNPVIDISASYVGQASITTLGTIATGVWNATAILEAKGGTGQTTYALGDMLYSDAANSLAKLPGNITAARKFLTQLGTGVVSAAPVWNAITLADLPSGSFVSSVSGTAGRITSTGGATPVINIDPAYVGQSTITTVGTITTGTWSATLIDETRGGTGQSAIAIGDILYGSAVNVLSRLADVATGNALISGGVGLAPAWGKIGLATHVSGILGETNGGTGQSTYALGNIIYSDAANSLAKLTGNITATKMFLTQTGTGVVSAAPAWGVITLADLPSGSFVTSVSGTAGRITSTGGNTPVINIDAAYVGQATITTVGTITSGTWSGTIIDETKGSTGQSAVAIGDILYGSAANVWSRLADVATGNALLSGGVGVAPLWGKVGLTTHISGILSEANGGTGDSTYLSGQLLIGNGTGLTKNLLTAGTNVTIVNGSGTITINATGGSTSFGNPTAQIGLVAINGVAATAMRSDAAPALDQDIAPTWTNPHIFTSSGATTFRLLSADGTGPTIQMQKRGSSGGGSSAAVASGSALGQMNFFGWTGAAYSRGAYILGIAAETFTGTASGGLLTFTTTTPGGVVDAERLRITQGISVGQAVSVSAGVINALTGYRISNAATSGQYLRGNGTSFVSSVIQVADLPSHPHAAADITSGIIALARLGLSGTPSTTTFLRGDNTWATPAGGGALGNPSGLIGMTAVNGVAVTGLRTDGRHAIDPAIAPVWSGAHIFTAAPRIRVDSNDLIPALVFERGLGGTQWGIHENGGLFCIRNITAGADRLQLNAFTSGFYLRANGTTFVGSQLSASDLVTGLCPPLRLGSGTPNSSTFLRGDQTWAVPPSGGGSTPPGGANAQVQFNNGGVFDGDVDFEWFTATNTLAVTNINAGTINATCLVAGGATIASSFGTTVAGSPAASGYVVFIASGHTFKVMVTP